MTFMPRQVLISCLADSFFKNGTGSNLVRLLTSQLSADFITCCLHVPPRWPHLTAFLHYILVHCVHMIYSYQSISYFCQKPPKLYSNVIHLFGSLPQPPVAIPAHLMFPIYGTVPLQVVLGNDDLHRQPSSGQGGNRL